VPFQRQDITLQQRVALGCAGVLFAGEYGLITDLARESGVSRQWLYRLRARASAALTTALAPQRSGRPPRAVPPRRPVQEPRRSLERAVLVLHQVAHASVRAIQTCLGDLPQAQRSVGRVQGVLATAAARARALRPAPRTPLQALADEPFAGRQPVLAVVDRPSGLAALPEPAESADETARGCARLDLAARGVTVRRVTADGAHGLAAGVRAAGLPAVRLDHWHALRELGRVAKRLEGTAYRALAAAEHAARAAAEARQAAVRGRRRGGRPPRAPTAPEQVTALGRAADAAIGRADGVATVQAWVTAVLRPVDGRTGHVRTAAEVVAELTAAADLLRELGGLATAAAGPLQRQAAGLAAYLDALQQALAAPRAALGEAGVTFPARAWCHRSALGLTDAAEARPADPAAARATGAALQDAVRASGMVENLSSVLACQRAARRGLPPTTLALAAASRNPQRFARGERAGSTPLELAGLPSPHWLDALGYGRPPPPAPPPLELPARPPKTVNTKAA